MDVANKEPGKTEVQINNLFCEAARWNYLSKGAVDFYRSIETQPGAARKMIGQTIDYNFLSNNCEHFITNGKYGFEFCSQSGGFWVG